jgi:hypothetical protein
MQSYKTFAKEMNVTQRRFLTKAQLRTDRASLILTNIERSAIKV